MKSPLWEALKAIIRYAILWLPVILEAMGQYETGGLVVALSVILTGFDKGIHETKTGALADYKGVIPF